MFFSSIYRVNYGGIKIRSFRWRRFFAKQVKVFRKRVKKKKKKTPSNFYIRELSGKRLLNVGVFQAEQTLDEEK